VLFIIGIATADPPTETATQQTAAPTTAAPATAAPESTATTQPPTTAAPTTETPETQPEADAATQASCRHFRNVMGDAGQGVLSDEELRDKLKEVNDSASVSERADIRAGGVAMLRAITIGDSDELLKAATQFDKACDRAGQ
jgi:hypothetical protein